MSGPTRAPRVNPRLMGLAKPVKSSRRAVHEGNNVLGRELRAHLEVILVEGDRPERKPPSLYARETHEAFLRAADLSPGDWGLLRHTIDAG